MKTDKHFRDQPSLFDQPARRSDPVTSKDAASKLNTAEKQKRFLQALHDRELTAYEVDDICLQCFGGVRESYRKRAAELVKMRMIEVVGTRGGRQVYRRCRRGLDK